MEKIQQQKLTQIFNRSKQMKSLNVQYLMMELYKGRYERIQRIGNGAYGVIYKVRSIPQGTILIAKHISLQYVEREKALQQFQILSKLRHHYIVRYIDSFALEDQLVLIMEYCGCSQINMQKKIYIGISNNVDNQYLVTNWILQMLLAIGFMHTNKVVHRDIKPQNIFVDSDMNLKIGDFGISRLLDSTAQNCKTSAGTPSYMAPEMVESQQYSYKADIWSLGCVIYEVCALDRMFPVKDSQNKPIGLFKMMDLIRQGEIKQIPNLYSQDLRKLIKKMLIRNPDKRPRAEDLLKDKLLVQLMINRINDKSNLKQQYPKGLEAPSLSESLLDRQANSIKEQMKKLESQVSQKMQGLKNKKVEKGQLSKYEDQIKLKMKEVQKAVKKAFQQLNKQGKFPQQSSPNKSQKVEETIKNQSINKNVSKMSNSSLQNSSDVTIQSMVITSKPQIIHNQSEVEVQSLMLESGAKFHKSKSKNDSKFSSNLRSQIQKSKQLKTQQEQQALFDKTIQTQFAQTVQNPALLTNTLNKLDFLQKTIQKNPQAVLSDSFLNCSLSLSQQPIFQKQTEASISNSISLQLTKREPKSEKTAKIQNEKQQIKMNKQEDESDYKQDFQSYQQNEELEARRAGQLQTMLSLYQQTLAELGQGQQFNTEGSKIRNKYLVMSEIKQQSNEGGSMISRNDSIQQ